MMFEVGEKTLHVEVGRSCPDSRSGVVIEQQSVARQKRSGHQRGSQEEERDVQTVRDEQAQSLTEPPRLTIEDAPRKELVEPRGDRAGGADQAQTRQVEERRLDRR